MRNSLLLKLIGAFILVIAVGAVVIALMTAQATQNAFTLYTTRSGQAWAQQISPLLADFFSVNQSWRGVDQFITEQISTSAPGQGMHGMGTGAGAGMGRPSYMANAMGAMINPRLILADAQGIVLSDSAASLTGKTLTASDLAKGAAIIADGKQVGTVIVAPDELSSPTTPASQFLASVNSSILTAVVIAGVIALVLGAALFLQITSPLRQLKKAANAIAQGDLDQRVKIQTRDELGELGQSFNRMADSLSRAQTARQHLVADVAHELRTPITVIQANIEGIQDGILPFDRDQISLIHSETLLLSRLVDDLRLLSLAESGELKLERARTDLGKMVSGVIERMQPQASQKGIALQADIASGLPDVLIDADRINQVFNNLIGNALRYTPEGGIITVQAKTSGTPGFLQVSVSDTGAGIAAEDLPHIFDRFYRADPSRARASGGSGLGLAIVKQLIEAHNGQVRAESPVAQSAGRPSLGARIEFTLPVSPPTAS